MRRRLRYLRLLLSVPLLLSVGCVKTIRQSSPQGEGEDPAIANTYITLRISREGQPLRARQPDWQGIDLIEELYLYIFDAGTDDSGCYIPFRVPADQQAAPIEATIPCRIKPGLKTIYIIANPSPGVRDALYRACKTSRSAFDRAYRDTAYSFLETNDFRDYATRYWDSPRYALTRSFIDSLAQVSHESGDAKYYAAKYGMVQPSIALTYLRSKKSETHFNVASRIMMTGEPVEQEIKDGVSRVEAPVENKVALIVSRTVAQLVVSERNPGVKAGGKNLLTPLLRCMIIHQEPASYLLGKKNAASELITPGHGVTGMQPYTPPAGSHDDYRLWTYVPWNKKDTENEDLDIDTPFEDVLFPSTTHPYRQYGGNGYGECFLLGGLYLPESSQPTGGYTWENTPLVVVQVSFDAGKLISFGSVFYIGKNGELYTDYARAFRANNPFGTPLPPNAATPEEQVKLKDNVITYPGARAYYIAPVNPLTGEVERNHIYRHHITYFSKMGYSGIPLKGSPMPCDPDDEVQLLTGPIPFPYAIAPGTRLAEESDVAVRTPYHTFEITF